MLTGGVHPGADHRPDHHWTLRFPAEHVAQLSALVEDLVHAAPEKVDKHEIGDRPQTGRRRPDRRPDKPRFRDRRVENAVAPEFLDQSLRHSHRTAPGILIDQVIDIRAARDVLAHQDDRRVFAHRDPQRLVDRIFVGEFPNLGHHRSHTCPLGQRLRNREVGLNSSTSHEYVTYTSVSASSGAGHGAALASAHALSSVAWTRASIASNSAAVARPRCSAYCRTP
jgi:hypothetical protein